MIERERLQQIEQLYHAALEREKSERLAFLEAACHGDADLLSEVKSLLAFETQNAGLLDEQPLDMAARAFADGKTQEAEETLSGQNVSHYRIIEKLGEGGMGVVYRAEDLKLGRMVALKFLREDPFRSKDDGVISRMKREARAASALNHPNICTIYEIGEHKEHPFIAMELLKGEPLDQYISRRKTDVGAAAPEEISAVLAMAVQVGGALKAAHTEGVLHRDVKPANIFLTEAGQAKLLDFGLAKWQRASDDFSSLTEAGATPGTVAYMSPEQIQGEELDGRTDIFSLGGVLYEMIAGRRAFDGRTALTVHNRILNQKAPSLATVRPGIPAALERIIDKALEKKREMRYQTAGELKNDAESVKRDLESGRRLKSASKFRRSRALVAAAVAVTSIAAILGTVGLVNRLNMSREARRIESVAVLPLENLSGDRAQEYLTDGLTAELIGDLSRISTLRVISRTSSMHYKGLKKTLPEIARELNVDGVIEGSVRRTGDKVRINVELIDAPRERQLWTADYERDVGQMDQLPQRAALAIAHDVSGELTLAGEKQLAGRRPIKTRAYDAYLRGQHALSQRGAVEISEAASYFEEALREDPNFALAWAGLSDCYSLGWNAKRDLPRAEGYVQRALALEPDLAEAHASLGYILYATFKLPEAEKELRRAIELNPNYSMAHHWYSLVLHCLGQPTQALAENNRAVQLNPFSLAVNYLRSNILMALHENDRAIEQIQATIAIFPSSPLPHELLARLYWMSDRVPEALAEERQTAVLSQHSHRVRGLDEVAAIYAKRGVGAAKLNFAQLKESEASGAAFRSKVPAGEESDVSIAIAYAEAGDEGKALYWLGEAMRNHDSGLLFSLEPAPEFDFIRQNPRFQDLLRRSGLPE